MASSKTYTRQQLQKRLGDKSERTIRRMQHREHRHYLPPPDVCGDRWSEDYLRQIEHNWHDADERRTFLRGKHIVPAGSFPMTTKVYIDGYAGRVLEAWQKQEADAHD